MKPFQGWLHARTIEWSGMAAPSDTLERPWIPHEIWSISPQPTVNSMIRGTMLEISITN